MPTIETRLLTHVYSPATVFKNTAIENINIKIASGSSVGIIGHTGSGKTTFVQHLNGLLCPSSGQVFLDGEDINASKASRRDARFKVGLVFQYPEYQLFEETVYRDIAFGPHNMKLSKAEIDERVHEAARFVGLSESLFDLSPLELSGGQKRRVAIAGVIAMRPGALVLDEPTAGLDPKGCEELMRNIEAYRHETGATVIFVSHSMELVARYTSRLIVFDSGRVVMDGTPEEVFSRSEALRAIGLDVPAATAIAGKLRELGLDVPENCYTLSGLKHAICALRKGGAPC
ncbi:MAG: energy-coupling factor transporter ATPase [Oscillospiraceae bacterium]|jgi:energy-coupling factor transport system ATP-binding protein|nr:energy-coupling factor transporter ATPase [Oscillospiraceae bacterium]